MGWRVLARLTTAEGWRVTRPILLATVLGALAALAIAFQRDLAPTDRYALPPHLVWYDTIGLVALVAPIGAAISAAVALGSYLDLRRSRSRHQTRRPRWRRTTINQGR